MSAKISSESLSAYHERLCSGLLRGSEAGALGVVPSAAMLKAALGRAHDLRRFEIENYWRRSTYVWGLQLVAFAALALSTKEGRFYPPIVVPVAALGILASWAAILTSRGSRFWQKNWERHVDFLEDAVEGRLHKTVLAEGGRPSWSVSRVNERFLVMLLVGWSAVFIAAAAAVYEPELLRLSAGNVKLVQIGLPALFVLTGIVAIASTTSDLADRLYDRDTVLPRATTRSG